MSDVNVLVWHWDEVAVIAAVWTAVAALAGAAFYRWLGKRAALWSLAVTVLGPPVLLAGTLGLMIVATG